MKELKVLLKATVLVLGVLLAPVSCRVRNLADVTSNALFSGSFVANVVKEGSVVVYRRGTTGNYIPGYSKFRIEFVAGSENRVRFTEYTGETFDGIWSYSEDNSTLSFRQLVPVPSAGNSIIFKVEKKERNDFVLSSISPNPKTGSTLNQYTLISE